MDDIRSCVFEIPAPSLNLNSIANMFHLVRANLQNERNQKSEMFAIFTSRMKDYQKPTSWNILDKTIESMPKKIVKIVSAKGECTKY